MPTATNNSPNLMSLLYPSSEPQTPNRGVPTPSRLPIGTPHGTPSSRPIGTPSYRPTITTTPNTSAIPAATPPLIGGGAIKRTPTGGGTDETTRTKPPSSATSIKQRTSLIDAFKAASNVPQDGGGGGGGSRCRCLRGTCSRSARGVRAHPCVSHLRPCVVACACMRTRISTPPGGRGGRREQGPALGAASQQAAGLQALLRQSRPPEEAAKSRPF